MGSGGLGKALKAGLKPPTSKKSFAKFFKDTKSLNAGNYLAKELTGSDVFEEGLYGKREAKEKAERDGIAYQAEQDAAALAAKNAAVDATNKESVITKRRRKASSLLSKAGSGIGSVLSSAGTLKDTLG